MLVRYAALPTQIHLFISARLASTSTSTLPLYTYPKKSHPTPHEIFHLSPGAPQSAVKSRYYELVRVHHPDAPHARTLPPHVCHERFQAITAAYDVLTGKARYQHNSRSSPSSPSSSSSGRRPAHSHARYHPRAEWAYEQAGAGDLDDRMKDNVIMAIGLAAIAFGFAPLVYMSPSSLFEKRHLSASQNLAQARRDAREFGSERMRGIRQRVRAQQVEEEMRARHEGAAG